MIDAVAESRFGIWIVAGAIILFDSAMLLYPGRFAYRLSSNKRISVFVIVPNYNLSVRNSNLFFTLITFPNFYYFSDIYSPYQSKKTLYTKLRSLYRLQAHYIVFSVASFGVFCLVLFVGPILSFWYGQSIAILLVAPVVYATAIAIGLIVFSKRLVFGLSKLDAIWYAIEMLLCPVLLVNTSKRLSSKLSKNVNTWQLVSLAEKDSVEIGSAIKENLAFFGVESERAPT